MVLNSLSMPRKRYIRRRRKGIETRVLVGWQGRLAIYNALLPIIGDRKHVAFFVSSGFSPDEASVAASIIRTVKDHLANAYAPKARKGMNFSFVIKVCRLTGLHPLQILMDDSLRIIRYREEFETRVAKAKYLSMTRLIGRLGA